jgi:hypothetical protein
VITVALVNAYDYLGRGDEYVAKMIAMVDRNLTVPHKFDVLGDCGLPGFWNKVALFRPGRFEGRVMFLDLDLVVTGPLDDLAETKGIIDLHDWGWPTHTYGSGVMVWDAGEHEEVWTKFTRDLPDRLHGDQDFMTQLGGWEPLPAPWQRSYRYHCKKGPPKGCKVVCFHGAPKQTDLPADHWAREYWR